MINNMVKYGTAVDVLVKLEEIGRRYRAGTKNSYLE